MEEKTVEFLPEYASVIISALALFVSSLSLIVTIITSLRQRKKLYCRFMPPTPVSMVFATDEKGHSVQPFDYPITHVVQFRLVNPSAIPLSYFDLNVIDVTDAKRRKLFNIPVQLWAHDRGYMSMGFIHKEKGFMQRVILPPDLYGTVPPNCCLEIMIPLDLSRSERIHISFKTTKRTLFKSKKHYISERFKTFYQDYTISQG